MPNWCKNNLIIEGNEKDIKEIKEKVKKDDEVFQITSLISPPEEIVVFEISPIPILNTKELKKRFKNKYGVEDTYEWNCHNIGCKWDVICSKLLINEKKKLKYEFDTPWTPPVEGIKNISRLFPGLTFTLEYDEPGMDLKGKIIIKNENILEIKT